MSFGSLDYEFTDLPATVTIPSGRTGEAFVVDGVATIEFSREAEWWIAQVDIHAACEGAGGERRRETFPQLADQVMSVLRSSRSDKIQDAVNREFEGAGFIQRTDSSNGDAYWARPRRA